MGVTEEEQPTEPDEPEQPRRCYEDRKIVGRKLICGCGRHILTFSDPRYPNDPGFSVT